MISIVILVITMAMAAMGRDRLDLPGGFATSCEHMALVNQNNHTGLRAVCQAPGNVTQCNILDLNDCFGFTRSTRHIDPEDKGNFNNWWPFQTCTLDSTGIKMQCSISYDSHRRSSVALNRSIVNDGGLLKCFENKAVTPPDCASRPAYSDSEHPSEAQTLLSSFTMLGASAAFLTAFFLYQ